MGNDEIKNVKYSASDKKGVLGTLEGICADTISATRNGRKYSNELWEKAFSDPIVEEYFDCGGIFGELGHPADRSETDMEKIAICMPEKPKKHGDGKLYGRWDILDTPNGRILKCLCDYGYKIGISSRGNGEVTEDFNGDETVEPDSYKLEAFDAVLLPAVKAARLSLVSESLNRNNDFKHALIESLNKSNADEKKIMQETLDRLHIDYKDSSENKEESKDSTKLNEAVSDGSKILKNLQEALKDNRELQKTINSLNEQLSVGYAKETELKRENDALKGKLKDLSLVLSASKTLRESLIKSQKTIRSLNIELSENKGKKSNLQRKLHESVSVRDKLCEDINTRDLELEQLKEEVVTLTKRLEESKTSRGKAYERLREDYQTLKHDVDANGKIAQKKLDEALEQNKNYKKLVQEAFDRYIECKASLVGVNVDQLRNSVGNSISFDRADRICEELRDRKRNLSKLPFPITESGVKMKAKDVPSSIVSNPDDVVDDSLLNFLNL